MIDNPHLYERSEAQEQGRTCWRYIIQDGDLSPADRLLWAGVILKHQHDLGAPVDEGKASKVLYEMYAAEPTEADKTFSRPS